MAPSTDPGGGFVSTGEVPASNSWGGSGDRRPLHLMTYILPPQLTIVRICDGFFVIIR